MNNENFKEKVYTFHEGDADDKIKEQLNSFLQELVNRRDTNSEGRLQAAFVIFPDSFGAKVCERNGEAPYDQSVINLVKFLDGKNDFLSIDQSFVYDLRREAMDEADAKGVRGRLVSGKDSFILDITGGKYSPLEDFQRKVLKEAIAFCEEIRSKGIYPAIKVYVYLYGEGLELECDPLTDSQLETLKVSFGADKK